MPQTVMIVDDDYTMNSLLQMLLEMDGFKVVLCPQADEVLLIARSEKPDVLLMDVHIGEADGLEILRTIRQDAGLKALPVIIQSGMDVEDKCKAAGASAFILKPYPPDQLGATLKKVLS
jgi:two-component system cell cycle response regulator DivK